MFHTFTTESLVEKKILALYRVYDGRMFVVCLSYVVCGMLLFCHVSFYIFTFYIFPSLPFPSFVCLLPQTHTGPPQVVPYTAPYGIDQCFGVKWVCVRGAYVARRECRFGIARVVQVEPAPCAEMANGAIHWRGGPAVALICGMKTQGMVPAAS